MDHFKTTISADLGVDSTAVQLEAAGSGASSKRYYRVSGIDSIAPGHHLLVMTAPQNTISDFLDMTRLFAVNNIRTPRIFRHNVLQGYLIIEDCGNMTLEQLVPTFSDADKEKHYKQVLDILLAIQSSVPSSSSIAASRFFDKKKFLFEYDFHICGKLIEGCLQYSLTDPEKKTLFDFYLKLVTELSEQAYVLVHRDFQSSNLIHTENSWVVIDHQDARMGLALYDLVSLIEDAYITLDLQIKKRLCAYYLNSARLKSLPVPSEETFSRIYDLTTIQRKLHDAGSFFFCFQNFGNIKYLSYINNVLQQALDVMSRYGEFVRPFELLTMISHAYLTQKQTR